MTHPTLGKGIVTSPYGYRSMGWHGGIDYGGLPVGTPVYSSYAGKVTAVVNNCPANGYYCSSCGMGGGNWVEITSGNIKTRYMHLNSVIIRLGQTIGEGQMLGGVGNSGCSTAAHLHYEIIVNGVNVDPAPYLKNASVQPNAGGGLLPYLVIGGILYYVLYGE